MYVGDTRLQALVTYTLTRDDRLPRAALRQFDDSRLPSGLTQSRYPSRVTQVITPFALWWVGMVHDYALWRDDPALVRELLPGVRAVIDGFGRFLNADGLVEAPAGWSPVSLSGEGPKGYVKVVSPDTRAVEVKWEQPRGPVSVHVRLPLPLIASNITWRASASVNV